MEFRLRRISFSREPRLVHGEDPNPFERIARRPYRGSPIHVCLHTTGLESLSDEQALILKELCAPYRRAAIKLSRTPGNPPGDWPSISGFEIERWNEEKGTVLATRGSTQIGTGIHTPNRWDANPTSTVPRPEC